MDSPHGRPEAVAPVPPDSGTGAARLRAAESAVAPWWSRAGAASAILLVAALGLLGVFLVAAGSAGTLSGSFVLSATGTIFIIGLAVSVLGLVTAAILVGRRRRAGVGIGLLFGIVMTAALGWVATSIVSFSLPDSTGLLVALSVGALAAAAATLVLSLTYGRLLALGRVQDEVGMRSF